MWSNPLAVTAAASGLFVVFWILTRDADRLSRVIFWGLIFTLGLVTLIFNPNFQNIVILKDIAAQVLGFSLFLLWLSRILRPNGFALAATPMNIAVLIFFLAGVGSAFLAPRWTWYYTLEEICRNAAVILMFFMVVKFMHTRSRWNICVHALIICMGLTSIYGVLQVHGFDFVRWGRLVNVSTFGNKDFFASFLTYTMPVALFMGVGCRNHFDRILYLAASSIGLYNIIQGETRGAWVGLMALIAVTLWFELKLGRLSGILVTAKKKIAFWGGLAAVVVLLATVAPAHKVETFKSIFQAERGTNIIRVYIWWASTRMWADQPVIGQGIGTYQLTYPYFRPDRYHRIGMSHNTRHAHSEELELLAEQGIIGFSAWAAFLAVFFFLSFKKLKNIEPQSERYIFYGLVGALLAGVVHDSINVNLRWMSSAIVFWFMLGLATRYWIGFEKETAAKGHAAATWAEIPLGIALLAVFAFMFHAEYRVLRSDYLLHIVEGTVENPATAKMDIEKAEEVLRLVPYDHSAMYKSAYAHLNRNEIDMAREKYDILMSIAPNYAQIHQNMALIAYRDFITTQRKKYLYQAILEFEWATSLENNTLNHSKTLQLYAQHSQNLTRSRYHNQFLLWNSQDDAFFNWSRYWKTAESHSARDNEYAHAEWIKPLQQFSRDYWVYRIDMSHRAERTRPASETPALGAAERLIRQEGRYAIRMAMRFVPDDHDLARIGLTALSAGGVSDADPALLAEAEEDMVYLIRAVEDLPNRHVSAERVLEGLRKARESLASSSHPSPLRSYALGVICSRMGDLEAARIYFRTAANISGGKYRLISDGIKRYGV